MRIVLGCVDLAALSAPRAGLSVGPARHQELLIGAHTVRGKPLTDVAPAASG